MAALIVSKGCKSAEKGMIRPQTAADAISANASASGKSRAPIGAEIPFFAHFFHAQTSFVPVLSLTLSPFPLLTTAPLLYQKQTGIANG